MNKNEEFEFDLMDYMSAEVIEAFVSHKSPPKGYPKKKIEYADPANYKYPIDSAERVRAAWHYINMPKNQKGYSPSQVASIKGRIKRAGHKFGVHFDGEKKD